MIKHIFFSLLFFLTLNSSLAAPTILNMRERAEVIDQWLQMRVSTVLPKLMNRSQIDMWVLISREYNEDPVIRTFLPSIWQSARRRTILLIYNPGNDQPLETLAVARYGVGNIFKKAWDKELHGEQWKRLADLIEERDPKRIGINYSETFALADGITKTEYDLFHQALPNYLHERVVSSEELAIGWLETRTSDEMYVYQQICRIAHEILAEGLSDKVIQPGVTSTNDVAWWYRDQIRQLGLTTWFHPSVSIQRPMKLVIDTKASIESRHDDNVIIPGDLLHVDFGITYLRLNTDTQQHAYVLKSGETDVPEKIKEAMRNGNRLQDILTKNFVVDRTGNEILKQSLSQAEDEGITASIYTHPIGYHGHAAGPTIGFWDQQGDSPGVGDYTLYPNTAYSIELYAETAVEDWEGPVRIKLEEDAFFDGTTVSYIDGRQKNIFLIPRKPAVQ